MPGGFVLLMGCWTLAYWVGLALHLRVEIIGALTAVLLVAVALVSSRARGHAEEAAPLPSGAGGARPDPVPAATWPRLVRWQRLGILVGYAVVVVLALKVSRVLALVVLLVAALAALARWWWMTRRSSASDPAGSASVSGTDGHHVVQPRTRVGWLLARQGTWWRLGTWVVAVALAGLSTQFARPDGDDVYFVGFSTYVAQHGLIPLRDTLMSAQVFPAMATYDPPLHSWETLIGLAARLTGIASPTMTYSVVLPVMVVVAVLALARLIDEVRVPWPLLSLCTASVLLLLDGGGSATFGLLWISRLWVGKVVLVAVVVPMLVVYSHRWLERRSGWDLVMLVAATVTAVGVSSSGVFVALLVLGAVMVAAIVLRRYRAGALLLLPMVPPAVIGLLTVVLAPGAPGPAQPLPPQLDQPDQTLGGSSDVLLRIFVLNGWHLVVVVGAVTLGVLGLRSRTARAMVVSLLAVFAVIVSPWGNAALLRVLPVLDAVMWRMWFLVPLPLLLAALPAGCVAVLTGTPRRLGCADAPARARWPRAALAVVVAGAAVAGFAASGRPIVEGPDAHRTGWLDYKAAPGDQQAFEFVAGQAKDGDVVLSPSASAHLVPVATSRWFAVAPRLDYLRSGYYRSLPQVHAVTRLRLQAWVRGLAPLPTTELARDLEQVGVDLVCTSRRFPGRQAQLVTLGWHETGRGRYACFRQSS
ncbi:MAG TPA: DUF6077 domain-containing protein [Actinomycetales bacterium]|nr:DUF6077 domain-containing protein [Actinomycetales bacterium]